MDIDIEKLSNDTQELKTMFVEVLGEHGRVVDEQRQACLELQEKFEALRRLYFGQSSEKLN